MWHCHYHKYSNFSNILKTNVNDKNIYIPLSNTLVSKNFFTKLLSVNLFLANTLELKTTGNLSSMHLTFPKVYLLHTAVWTTYGKCEAQTMPIYLLTAL